VVVWQVHGLINDMAQAIEDADPSAAVQCVLALLDSFDVSQAEALPGLLSSMLEKVLGAWGVDDVLVVGGCRRTVEKFAAMVDAYDDGRLFTAMPPAAGPVDDETDSIASLRNRWYVVAHALAAAVLEPESVTMAAELALLSMLGVAAPEALLAVTSGSPLHAALEAAGVPSSHPFQRTATNAVRALGTGKQVPARPPRSRT
jgi:hypothetical protein